jgi:hypothetical protein
MRELVIAWVAAFQRNTSMERSGFCPTKLPSLMKATRLPSPEIDGL